jgi:hypothetical protein
MGLSSNMPRSYLQHMTVDAVRHDAYAPRNRQAEACRLRRVDEAGQRFAAIAAICASVSRTHRPID